MAKSKVKKPKKKVIKKAIKVKQKTKSAVSAKSELKDRSPNLASGSQKIRVLIAKPGLDGHDRGAKVIARALMDAGFEIIYTGLHQTPEMIINTALQEDVHVIGLSILSGAHNALVPEIVNGVRKSGGKDMLYLVGGIIPEEDFPYLKKSGADMIFTPGSSLESVVNYINKNVKRRVLE